MRLIDADELFKTPMGCSRGNGKPLASLWAYVVDQITHAPTIDPESLRPVGRWIIIDDDYVWDAEADDECYVVIECECSVCGERTKKDRPNYCDNCGAKMEG